MYQAKVTGGRLNIRSGPGTKYSILKQAAEGSVVDVLDDLDPDWWRIRQDGVTGYCMSRYLVPINSEPPAETPDEPLKETVEIPLDLAMQMYRTLGEQLGMIVDARSGNISNIDYQ